MIRINTLKLIIGLGNPGSRYAGNRHNIGFICLNYFARTHGIKFDKKQGLARIGMGEVAGHRIILAKPQTYMNSSGDSVRRLVNKFYIDVADLVVIHDDLDLPLGKIRVRQGGSSAGHKGIQSIINNLESPDFIRLRIGIGRPSTVVSEEDIIAYVLSDFSGEEKQTIATVIPRAGDTITCLLAEGLTATMNKFNKGTASLSPESD